MAKKFNEYTIDDVNDLEQNGLISPETAESWRSSLPQMSSMPTVQEEEVVEQAPDRSLQGFEKFEYGIGKVFEPLIGPITHGSGKAGQEAYDNALRDRIISNRPKQGQASTASPAQPIEQTKEVSMGQTPEGTTTTETVQTEEQMPPVPPAPAVKQGSGMRRADTSGLDQNNREQDNLLTRMEKAQNSFNERIKTMERASEELANKPFTNFWENKSTGNRLTAMLGVLAGGIINGMNGQALAENPMLKILNNTIAEDLENQKMEYNKKRNSFKDSMDLNKQAFDAEMSYIDGAFKILNKKAENFVKGEDLKRLQDALNVEKMKLLQAPVKATQGQIEREKGNQSQLEKYNPNRESLYQETERLEKALEKLKKGKGLTGLENALKIEKFSPEMMEIKRAFDAITSKNLKEILGGQFAMREGDELKAQQFDAWLSEEVNHENGSRLLKGIRDRMNYLDGMEAHYQKYDRTYDYKPAPSREQSLRNLKQGPIKSKDDLK